ncbi:SprT-like domain-containing protein [Bdellovibrionota bacterium FG-2]
MQKPSLSELFSKLNELHFDGFLDEPVLCWNTRLRVSAGRFIPGSRKFFRERPVKIEVASYLLEEEQSLKLVEDTMAHEMIHYWLWVLRRPYGHTDQFLIKMKAMGATRYNSVPRRRNFLYIYRCPSCLKDYPARRKLGDLACLGCCKIHAGGRFDRRFRLLFQAAFPEKSSGTATEVLQAPNQGL